MNSKIHYFQNCFLKIAHSEKTFSKMHPLKIHFQNFSLELYITIFTFNLFFIRVARRNCYVVRNMANRFFLNVFKFF